VDRPLHPQGSAASQHGGTIQIAPQRQIRLAVPVLIRRYGHLAQSCAQERVAACWAAVRDPTLQVPAQEQYLRSTGCLNSCPPRSAKSRTPAGFGSLSTMT